MPSHQTVNRLDVEIHIPELAGHPLSGRTLTFKDDLARDLVGVQVSKNMRTPAGTFSLVFTARFVQDRLTWTDLIPMFSLVRIKMWHSSTEKEQAVMLGLVEGHEESENFGQQNAPRTRSVIGKSVGALMSDMKLYMLLVSHGIESKALLGVRDQLAGILLDTNLLTEQKTAAEILPAILNRYLQTINLQIPGTATTSVGPVPVTDATSIIKFDPAYFESFDPDAVFPIPPTFMHSGSLWSVLEQYQDPTFNEMFMDTDPSGDFEEFVFRPHPFARSFSPGATLDTLFDDDALGKRSSSRAKVATLTLTESALIAWKLARGTADIFNLFWVLPTNPLLTEDEFKATYPPSICAGDDPASIDRFGVRAMEVRSPYMPRAVNLEDATAADRNKIESTGSSLAAFYQRGADTLQSWHRYNQFLYSGTILCQGRARYRIGDRLVCPRRHATYEFLMEGIVYNFDITSGAFTCQLGVSRGYKLGSITNALHPEYRSMRAGDEEVEEDLRDDSSARDFDFGGGVLA